MQIYYYDNVISILCTLPVGTYTTTKWQLLQYTIRTFYIFVTIVVCLNSFESINITNHIT